MHVVNIIAHAAVNVKVENPRRYYKQTKKKERGNSFYTVHSTKSKYFSFHH